MPAQKDLTIKKSRNGKGVFAGRDFADGEVVLEVEGSRITCNEDDDLDETTRANTYRFDNDTYISPGKHMANYVNHSCEPNARVIKLKGKLFLKAIGKISTGEEIVFDYSTILAQDDSWEMVCNCGTQSCRGTVLKFNRLPKKLREEYVRRKIVPQYILSIGLNI